MARLDASHELLEEAAGGTLVQPPAHVQEVKQLARLLTLQPGITCQLRATSC
jgi:hypothetical protein